MGKLTKWLYQEWWVEWTMWTFGWTTKNGRGWRYNELLIAIGPLRFNFLLESD